MSGKIENLVYIKNSLGESIFGTVEVDSTKGLSEVVVKRPRILTRTQTGGVGIGHFDAIAIGLDIPEIMIPVSAIVAFVDVSTSNNYEAIKTSYEASLAGVKLEASEEEKAPTVDVGAGEL